jgi:hypothetical protein
MLIVMRKLSIVLILGTTLVLSSLPEVIVQVVVTSPPPTQVVLVTNSYACALTKHPALPVLYLTCYGAPQSKNLITFRLNTDGSWIAEGQKAWPDYFSVNSTNADYRYYIPRPVIAPEEKILYLVNYPLNPPVYYAETNNNAVAVVGLDEQGLPAKLLTAFRTTDTEQGLYAVGWVPTSRRLLLSYGTYFGWCQMDKAGLPVTNQFQLLYPPSNFWFYLYETEWQRYYGYERNAGLGIIKLNSEGSSAEFVQCATSGSGSNGNIALSRRFLKLYLLDSQDNKQIRVYQLTAEGRLTSVPRFFLQIGRAHV